MACCCKPLEDDKRIEKLGSVVTALQDETGKSREVVLELDVKEDGKIIPLASGSERVPDVDELATAGESANVEKPVDSEKPLTLEQLDAEEVADVQAPTPAEKFTLEQLDAPSTADTPAVEPDYDKLRKQISNIIGPHLLRAVSIPTVLANFGKNWAGMIKGGPSSQQSQMLYGLTRSVDGYKEYLSHRRLDARWKKVLTLLLYYNKVPAAVMGTAMAVLACLLRSVDVLPAGDVNDTKNAGKIAPWSLVIGYVTFLSCLFTWHRLPSRVGGSADRDVFADNFCINYAEAKDKELQIRNFVAYIASSDRILVMWSEDYFSRLWTTLEIATAVLICSSAKNLDCPLKASTKHKPLKFRPINLSVGTLAAMFLMFLCYLISILTRLSRFGTGAGAAATQTLSFMAIQVCIWPVNVYALQIWLADRRELKNDLKHFEAEKGEEEDADERKFIFETIASLWSSVEEFDNYVRFKVGDAIYQSFGTGRTLPSYSYVIGLLPAFWAQLDYAVYYFDFYRDYPDRAIQYCFNQIAVVACIFTQFPILVLVLRELGIRGQSRASIFWSLVIGVFHGLSFLFQVGLLVSFTEWWGLLWPSIGCLVGYVLASAALIYFGKRKAV